MAQQSIDILDGMGRVGVIIDSRAIERAVTEIGKIEPDAAETGRREFTREIDV